MGRKKEATPQAEDPELEYEVEEIVGHKIDDEDTEKVKYLYRVRWLGYNSRDDTWEPKESLEGGAEGILEEYINDRKNNGFVFFRDGSKKIKVAKYLSDKGLSEEVLSYDAGRSDSDDESTTEEENDEEDDERTKKMKAKKAAAKAASKAEKASEKAEKEKKRKKRESDAKAAAAAAAAAAQNGGDMDEDDLDDRRSHHKKARRNSGSPLPIPPSVLRGRDERDKAKKEKTDREKELADRATAAAVEASTSKKPSSKRSNVEEEELPIKKKEKRPSTVAVTNDSEDDNEAVETSLKRSPLKEKKADQHRKSEEAPLSRTSNNNSSSNSAKKTIDEVVKAPLVSSIIPQEEEEEEIELPLGSEVNSSLSTWEDLLTVESLEQQNAPGDKEYKWLIRWNNEIQQPKGIKINTEEWIGNALARKKFPQGLLSFYEDHLKFKSTPDDDIEDEGINGAGINGGDGIAMEQD